MSDISIFFEGTRQSAGVSANLRYGMGEFLKSLRDKARRAGWHWKVVACGSRNETFAAFTNEIANAPRTCNILLVDSEETVSLAPVAHLANRDPWVFPIGIADRVHLMVCVMETWMVGDPAALDSYYKQRFNRTALPRRHNLELVPKADVYAALVKATRFTQKGLYHKTRHAPALLALLDPTMVRNRCPHCERLFAFIDGQVP